MWIERIELAGFGSVVGEQIDFASNKLNLLVEANEFGKSTMATAVWGALFDFPDGLTSGNSHGAQNSQGREPCDRVPVRICPSEFHCGRQSVTGS